MLDIEAASAGTADDGVGPGLRRRPIEPETAATADLESGGAAIRVGHLLCIHDLAPAAIRAGQSDGIVRDASHRLRMSLEIR